MKRVLDTKKLRQLWGISLIAADVSALVIIGTRLVGIPIDKQGVTTL